MARQAHHDSARTSIRSFLRRAGLQSGNQEKPVRVHYRRDLSLLTGAPSGRSSVGLTDEWHRFSRVRTIFDRRNVKLGLTTSSVTVGFSRVPLDSQAGS